MVVKALSYLRVSGESQIEGAGFPRQRETISKRIAQYDVRYVCEYYEEGISGTLDQDDRPALAELLADLAADPEIKLVFIERVDRFSRKLIVQELVIEEFRKLGVRVIDAESDIDVSVLDDDPGRVLIRQIFGAIAQFEKSSIVKKLRHARQRKKKEHGRCEGAKPFGEHPKKPDEKPIRDRIIELREEGRKFSEIAQVLIDERRPSRHGGRWTRQRVRAIYRRSLGVSAA